MDKWTDPKKELYDYKSNERDFYGKPNLKKGLRIKLDKMLNDWAGEDETKKKVILLHRHCFKEDLVYDKCEKHIISHAEAYCRLYLREALNE